MDLSVPLTLIPVMLRFPKTERAREPGHQNADNLVFVERGRSLRM